MKKPAKIASTVMSTIVLFSIMSCVGDREEKCARKSYIISYNLNGGYEAEYSEIENLSMPYINIRVQPDPFALEIWEAKYSDEKNRLFDSLSRKNNDTHYPGGKIRLLPGVASSRYPHYTAHDIESLDIVSDKDFCGIPAGESLAGIVRLVGFSCDEYINAGYKAVYDYTDKASCDRLSEAFKTSMQRYLPNGKSALESGKLSCLYPTDKSLSEVSAKDLKLLGSGYMDDVCNLVFERVPDTADTHVFTVTIKGDNGKVYAMNVKARFSN